MAADDPYLDAQSAPTRAQIDGSSGLLLLEFGTAWCGYCRALAPDVARLVAARPALRHIRVEDGRGRALGRSFGVKLWPNLVFLKDGAVIRQLARPDAHALEQAFLVLDAS
jgi:thioredoxin 1